MPDGMPAGMAIGSFTSASLDPPLVAFLPAKSSSSWPRIHEAGSFCASVLGHGEPILVVVSRLHEPRAPLMASF